MKCVHLIVSGKVQGVFFRDSTRKKALGLGLKGYAKNLPDGNVEVVAEGNEKNLKELVDFIKKNPGYSNVRNVGMKRKEIQNFSSFEVN